MAKQTPFNKSDETVQQGDSLRNREKIIVTGEIQYGAVFLEASRILNPSVPCR